MTFKWKRSTIGDYVSQYRYQRRLEIAAIVGVFATLLMAGTSFALDPSEAVFGQLTKDLGTPISPMIFAVWCYMSAAATLLLETSFVRRKKAESRRYLYILAAAPIPVYTVPVGWFYLRTGTAGLSAYIFLLVFYLLALTASAVYRDNID